MMRHEEDKRLRDVLGAYLAGLLCDITGLGPERLGQTTPFDEIGLGSLAVVAFNTRIEALFPGLPKTLLFDCRMLDEVCTYLLRDHPAAVHRLAGSPATPDRQPNLQPSLLDEWPELPFLDIGGGAGSHGIAIVGMHARLPGAPTPDEFWNLLAAGTDAVGEIPAERWPLEGFFEPGTLSKETGRSYAKWGAFLEGADRFDAQFFGISPRDAALIDPQERLFLECAWHAMEDAALLGERADGIRGEGGGLDVGVFVGVTTNSHALLGPDRWRDGGTDIPTAMPWSVANRASYALNLCGPSLAVDTACSSSLVALHLACESLVRGECRAALAGGVNLYLHPSKYVQLCQQHMLSPTGRCRSFGTGADGFVPGEGVGAVVLKPLDAARRDGDRILGVILGSAVNHGGRTNGFTVPSPGAQARLIGRALVNAGIPAASIGYVEAHGTGTPLGDPIEITGLKQALDGDDPCAVGSVKSNIGHLEAAAGIAALVKVLLQMRHRRIVPSIHTETLNPALGIEGSRFHIPRDLGVWQPDPVSGTLRAGISSFGAGGANAHLILQEAPSQDAEAGAAGPMVFPVSARSATQLREAVEALRDFAAAWGADRDAAARLTRVAFTLQCGRHHFEHRFAAVAADHAQLMERLARFLDGGEDVSGVHAGRAAANGPAAPEFCDAAALARAWVQGSGVVWQALWSSRPLPEPGLRYPFARDLHRLSAVDRVPTPVPDGGGALAFPFASGDAVLRDHRIGGKAVLPAAAYLHCCRDVAERFGLFGPLYLRNLTWAQPFTLSDGGHGTVLCTVRRQDARLSLEFASGGEGAILFRAEAQSGVPTPPPIPAPPPSLAQARAACTLPDDARRWYAVFKELGIEYGPGFQCMEQAWLGDEQAVVELRRRTDEASGTSAGPLDPAMLDGVLQSAFLASAALRGRTRTAFVPYSAKTLRIRGPLGERALVHVRRRSGPRAGMPGGPPIGMEVFDFTVFAPDGSPLIEIGEFTFRQFDAAGADRRGPSDHALHMLEPVWIEEPLPEAPPSAVGRNMLVFDRDAGLYEELQAAGAGTAWLALEGDRFEFRDRHTVEWAPAQPDHPDLLWRLLASQDALPDVVVFNIAGPQGAELEAVESAAGMLRSLFRRSAGPRVHVLFIVRRGAGAAPPAGAAVAGLLRSVHLEIPTVTGTVLELAGGHGDAPSILDEATRGSRDEVTEVRWGERTREVRRTRFIDAPQDAALLPFAPGDVIVLTGGLGAVGRCFAEDLARIPGLRIALVGRSPAGAKSAEILAALGRHGATADYWQADCADRDGMEALLASMRGRFGPIAGVIHGAGVLRDSFFVRQTRADWDAVLDAKLRGARWLDELTRRDPLKRFVLCSSLAGVHGNVGQSAYAFANAWLDRFAEHRQNLVRSGIRRGDTLSVAWPLWRTDHGMQAPGHVTAWLTRNGLSLLPPEDGIAALHAGLAAPRPVLIPLRGRRDAAARMLGAVAPVRSDPVPAVPATMAAPDEAVLVAFLARQLAQVTGTPFDRIDPDAALDVFGLDSILMMELNVLLDPHFPQLAKTALFESRSLRALARLLFEEHADDATRLTAGEAGRDAADGPVPESAMEFVKTSAEPVQRQPAARHTGDIAIVGLAGRYPGSEDLDAFWEDLAAGRDLVTEIPGRWAADTAATNGIYARWGGFLADIDKFDPLFFGISPRDAERMDPQERLFLQTAWHAVEDAGYTPASLSSPRDGSQPRRRVGVIVGVMYGEYQFYGAASGLDRPRTLTNSSYASIANRVSFCLDLDGPSFAVDSMCSSSLTSIHLACELLRGGGCEMAIAGGVNLSIHPYKYRMLCDLTFASTEGKCRSFGDGGDGYVPGEGVGAVLLRPLADALRDGDHIRAVIRGSDIGHGARTSGFTVPNADAQAAVIRRAFLRSGSPSAQLGYVEAHGTGTGLGDPIEIRGLTKALAPHLPPDRRCPVGSVKANIGHLESAAGMAALTKVLLQMEHGRLAPSIHADPPNRNIDFSRTPFFVQRDLADWPAPIDGEGCALPRVAAISSFGAGGANAHLIVEEHLPEPAGDIVGERQVFLFSARGRDQLLAYVRRFVRFLDRAQRDAHPAMPGRLGRRGFTTRDVAATLTAGRQPFEIRLAVVADSFEALHAALVRCLALAEKGGLEAASEALAAAGAFHGRAVTPPPAVEGGSTEAVARGWTCGGPPPPVPAVWRKAALPGYEFLRKRCWVDEEPVPAPVPRPTPSAILERVARNEITREEARSLLRAMA